MEGRSTAPGTQPGWLDTSATFDFVGLEEGSTQIVTEARPLAETLPPTLLHDDAVKALLNGTTSLDLFEESLRDAAEGRTESEKYDPALIDTFATLGRIVNPERGIEAMRFRGDGDVVLFEVRDSNVATIKKLKRQTPSPTTVMIAGVLDAIRHSDRMFSLVLASGQTIRGIAAEPITPAEMAGLFGRSAIVSGTASYRPSGSLLRIEASRIQSASDEALEMFSQIPLPFLASETLGEYRQFQGPIGGISNLYGQWPGDETDEQIDRVLSEDA